MAAFLAALQMAKSMQKPNESSPMVGEAAPAEAAPAAPPAWDWTKMMPGAVRSASQNSAFGGGMGGGMDWMRMK